MDLKIIAQKSMPNINSSGIEFGEIIETVYECPCTKGKVYLAVENILGYHDWQASIDCSDCNIKYELLWGKGVLPGHSPMIEERYF